MDWVTKIIGRKWFFPVVIVGFVLPVAVGVVLTIFENYYKSQFGSQSDISANNKELDIQNTQEANSEKVEKVIDGENIERPFDKLLNMYKSELAERKKIYEERLNFKYLDGDIPREPLIYSVF